MKAELHSMMDHQLQQRQWRIHHASIIKDTTTMWKLIIAAVEAAFVEFFELKPPEAKKIKGRAVVTILD